MKEYKRGRYSGERAMFGAKDAIFIDCIFEDGESPLKHGENLKIVGGMLKWKYPFWYAKNVDVSRATWFENARAGVWYADDFTATDCLIEAPKNFRRCNRVKLKNVSFSNAAETMWSCEDVTLEDVTVTRGDYFGMNCRGVRTRNLNLYGNYAFDGARDIEIRDSRLLTKDAFWNTENVTVYDSFISGEYLGWNSRNLTLVNCTIQSLQGMCYIDDLKLVNCSLLDTTLCFEYSGVEADVTGDIESVLNPSSGTIKADSIGELIIEKDRIDPSRTRIVCSDIKKSSDRPEWLR